MRRTRQQLKRAAYHEAGHAVIARVLTLASGYATIKPNYREGEAGHHITFDPYKCEHEWGKRGEVRHSVGAVWHARIITYMAGAEAEHELLRSKAIGDGDDRRQIEFMACSAGFRADDDCQTAHWLKLEPRLRTMTRMLVRRHRARIERVAKALLAIERLSRTALDKLVGRSVNDVKVNAPFLLAMHRMRRKERAARR